MELSDRLISGGFAALTLLACTSWRARRTILGVMMIPTVVLTSMTRTLHGFGRQFVGFCGWVNLQLQK